MKKINKSPAPNPLTEFAQTNSSGNWNDFRNYKSGVAYSEVKRLMFADQWQLCAFCETRIESTPETAHLQRVEHFHAKSDHSIPDKNWALDWQNVIGVCLGGSGSNNDSTLYPTPANLSCDAFKDHLVSKSILPVDCEGYVLNPLFLNASPCLFDLEKRTGKLKPNDAACGQVVIPANHYESVAVLVQKTIDILNLNCDRLNQKRLVILHEYERQLKRARQTNNRDIFQTLAQHWFSQHWPAFFTTRRILLGTHAETYLHEMAYNG